VSRGFRSSRSSRLPVRILAVVAAWYLVGVAAGAPAHGFPRPDAAVLTNPKPVRSTMTWGLSLIAEGCQRSASFRALVERLRATNLIIYVEPAVQLPGVTIGITQLLGVNGEFRYLRVSIDANATRKELIALVGHELQHAVEIGGAPEVVDQATLQALFRRIGHESVDGYDTDAARAIGEVTAG